MATPLKSALSHLVGWAADRRVPTPLRGPLYRTYAALTGADLSEARGPLTIYPNLTAFFTRRLVEGARPVETDPDLLVSPVDGTYQDLSEVREGSILQAKGHPYPLRELLAGVGEELELEGGRAWTIYLSPRDYHRIHTPEACRLVEARWVPGERHSVAPSVLARRRVLAINERCVLRLETARGPLLLVLVGALNVSRIRVVGVEPGARVDLGEGRPLERGAELARFEMGSTIVLVAPPAKWVPLENCTPGDPVKLGQGIGRWLGGAPA